MVIRGSPGASKQQLTLRNKFGLISLARPERESRRSGSEVKIIPPRPSAYKKVDRQLAQIKPTVSDYSSKQVEVKKV